MFTSSSSSFSPLSRALENQSQPPTPVTPTPYSCHPIPYTRQLAPVTYTGSIQCSTPYTVDPKPQALDPTPLALQRAGPRLAAPLAQIHLAALRAANGVLEISFGTELSQCACVQYSKLEKGRGQRV